MTAPDPLRPLRRRLATGTTEDARRALTDETAPAPAHVGTPEIRARLGDLYDARYAAKGKAGVTRTLRQLSQDLATDRLALLTLLLAPDGILDALPAWLPGRDAAGDDLDRWLGLCWLAEAAWQMLDERLPGPDLAPGDHALLAPLAARLRFVVLTEPMRHRGDTTSPWTPDTTSTLQHGPHGICSRVFGTSSWNAYVGRTRHARRTWRDTLHTYQTHPYLASADPRHLDDDLALLAFTWPTATRRHGARPLGPPLVLSVRPLDRPAAVTAEDATTLDDITDRHLLPRFALTPVLALGLHDDTTVGRVARRLAAGAVLGVALAALLVAGLLHLRAAAGLAAACYGLLAAGTVAFGARWAAPWLLRLPAASAVGLLALISFLPGSWVTAPHPAPWAATALFLLAAGYLVVETRNHGTTAAQAVRRAGLVLAVGAAHATLVALLGLVSVAPAFLPDGDALGQLWGTPNTAGHEGAILALSAAWCLATGVLSQILWDDHPITAPLAHLSWRSPDPPG